MTARHFAVQSERLESGYRAFVSCTCRKCGRQEDVAVATGRTTLPDQVISKKFSSRGWRLGTSSSGDICPDCANKREVKPVLSVVKTELPREMQREDRRIIFDKLNGVYLDEKRGYDNGWSDHRVASDLGVPRKWVETVREEMFGSVAINEDMARYAVEADELLREARSILDQARQLRVAFDKAVADFPLARIQNIEERIVKVDRLANDVRKLMVNPS